jgi:hypothetical protein
LFQDVLKLDLAHPDDWPALTFDDDDVLG